MSLAPPHQRHRPVRRGRFGTIDRVAVVTVVLMLFVVPSAFAGSVDQGGRYMSGFSQAANKLVSTSARVVSASPSSGSCILTDVVQAGATNQLETGPGPV